MALFSNFLRSAAHTSDCAEGYERNYQEYAAKVGFPDALYSREDLTFIGAEHRNLAILGKGASGEVYKVLKSKDGTAFAIKVLSGGGDREMQEVHIMSRPPHVS